ncbi:hypothetical protein ES754_11255 [Psychrobacter frigidicola]|uniref:Uncharacterized protein n=1 Tax=Psychrobacter frigidicola TaxID=45611 RepID=A0A5C6ZZ14_9GAMM|nr:hypothetical protein [Psychrobacter frigidicola]TXD96205.1 hypothetical protein ES754_11255 [Psychrobacter frigidicola]
MAYMFNNYDQKKYVEKKVMSLTDREAIWLRDYLADTINENFSGIEFINLKKNLLLELYEYKDFKKIIDESMICMGSSLTPEKYFQWLSGNLRAQIFSINVLQENRHHKSSIDNYDSSAMNNIYSFLDFLKFGDSFASLDNKADILTLNKIIWDTVSGEENYSKWLKGECVKQIEWAQNYLKDKGCYVEADIDNSNHSEIRSRVLASLDLIDHPVDIATSKNYEQSDGKILFISRMKKAWTQQKQRDEGKTKKPYHLPLTKETKGRLEKMAEVKGLSQTALLDILINSAYNLEFLDVDGNEIF